ncbi:DUF4402 domain-containing protein [Bdellovibrio bacteriovorus]|uniref:DUF4402 domain-containing protein n=1 Tax=Bdellovibrio bacteriovorus TaxID=959 RepID=UPI0035A96779
MKHVLFIATVATMIFSGYQAQAAQGLGKAKMRVVTAVAINKVSDLIFDDVGAGAAEETVPADSTDNAKNASFAITGEPSRPITVTLPSDGVVVMATGGGGADETIAVNSFTSNNVTQLDVAGNAELLVGATRAALSATQVAGDYEANFTVDVVY